MKNKLRDIVATAICKFNIEIDENNNFAGAISDDRCEQTCDYCRLFAEYICNQISGDTHDEQPD